MYIYETTIKDMDIKSLTNDIYESLKEDGFFKSEFIDEHKFKARFYKTMSNSNVTTEQLSAESIMDLVMEITKEIIKENVDNTVSELKDKGILNEVETEDGEIGYVLNENVNIESYE